MGQTLQQITSLAAAASTSVLLFAITFIGMQSLHAPIL